MILSYLYPITTRLESEQLEDVFNGLDLIYIYWLEGILPEDNFSDNDAKDTNEAVSFN